MLRPAQVRTAKELYESTGVQAVLGLGGGKTAAELTAIVDLKRDGLIRSAIITAPVRVALSTWPDEIAEWEHTADLDFVVLKGSPDKRRKLLRETHDIYICSIDNMVWLIDELRKFPADDPRWDLLVIDELSRFKGPRGERAKKLYRFVERFKAVHGLTGTPRPKTWLDQYAPIRIISGGVAWGGMGYDAFLKENCIATDWRGFKWDVREDKVAAIHAEILDWTFTIPPHEATDVPFNSGPDFDVVTPLSQAQLDDLESLQKELLIELGHDDIADLRIEDGDDTLVAALSQAVASGKMSQILQGFLYRDGETVQIYKNAKLDALKDLLEAVDGENVVIVYQYRHDLEMLKKLLPGARWVDESGTDEDFVQLIADCRAGKVQYLIAHVANLGHGVNGLQQEFSRMIWYSFTWSGEYYEQMIRRIARPGQTRPVYSHRILADHWLERLRVERVETAMQEQKDFIQTLRTI